MRSSGMTPARWSGENLSHGTVSTGCQKSLRTRLASRSAMARKEDAMVELKIETLARRLDRVERENRRIKRAGRSRTVKRGAR